MALLVLLPKLDWDLSSYRPISLLNMDYKILTTILTARMNKIINSYISSDQAVFIKNQQMRLQEESVMLLTLYEIKRFHLYCTLLMLKSLSIG